MGPYMRSQDVRSVVVLALTLAAACDGCGDDPAKADAGGGAADACVVDDDCTGGRVCAGGTCAEPIRGDGGALPIDDGGVVVGEDGGAVVLGQLSVLPGTLVEFGAQRIGVPVQRIVTLTNVGTVPLVVRQIVLDENEDGAFTADPVGDLEEPLAPQASLAVTVVNTPADGLPDSARLLVLHTGQGGLLAVDLFAEFKGVSDLSVTGDPGVTTPSIGQIDLGAVPLGSARSATIYVRNVGAADSILGLSSVSLVPASVGFTATHGSLDDVLFLSPWDETCPNGLTDCPGTASACTNGACVDADGAPLGGFAIRVTFTATTVGPEEATLTIVSDEGGVPSAQTDVALRASGVSGSIVIEPNPVEMGIVYTDTPAQQTIRIVNVGGAATTIQSLVVGGTAPRFSISHAFALPFELGAEEAVEATVTFLSDIAIDSSRTLTIDVDGPTDATVELHAIAREPPSAVLLTDAVQPFGGSPAAAFGDRYVGLAATKTIYVANLGPGTLTVARATIEGDDAAAFAVFAPALESALPAVIAGNIDDPNPAVRYQPRAEVTIQYTPSTLSNTTDTATLVFETDDPDQPTIEVALTGRAVQPTISVTPTTVDFGPVLTGAPTVTREIEVRNTGFGPLVISSISAPAMSEFTVTPSATLPVTLEATDPPLVLEVAFDPEADTGSIADTFAIGSNDVLRSSVVVTLGGGGETCPVRANATVSTTTGSCVYTCLDDFHACGDICTSNSSPDSCGTESCTPCSSRTNATRGCANGQTQPIGQCTYTCPSPRYDLNGDLSVPQGTFSNGCEYLCPVTNPTAEQCDDIDNDCDGTADDNLPLENPEPGNNCGNYRDLGDVNDENVAFVFNGYMLYPSGDNDWFRVRAHETESNVCAPWNDEDYKTTFRLKGIHSGRDYDLEVREDSCTGAVVARGQNGTSSNPNVSESVSYEWSGSCGGEDNKYFYIRVYPFTGFSCDDYVLEVQHDHL